MIITIDGPVATGKSTVARWVAERMGFIFYDTGAMYRCLTYDLIQKNIDLDDKKAIKNALEDFQYEVAVHFGDKHYYVNGQDVTSEIRKEAVTSQVSKVSAIDIVREKLVAIQRKLGDGVNAVFEGRDMGSFVFPDAEVKIFLTGRPEVRAKRRFDELRSKFPADTINLTIEDALKEIQRRDTYDSTREVSPLKPADDAIFVDTSDLTLDEVVDKILDISQNF